MLLAFGGVKHRYHTSPHATHPEKAHDELGATRLVTDWNEQLVSVFEVALVRSELNPA